MAVAGAGLVAGAGAVAGAVVGAGAVARAGAVAGAGAVAPAADVGGGVALSAAERAAIYREIDALYEPSEEIVVAR